MYSQGLLGLPDLPRRKDFTGYDSQEPPFEITCPVVSPEEDVQKLAHFASELRSLEIWLNEAFEHMEYANFKRNQILGDNPDLAGRKDQLEASRRTDTPEYSHLNHQAGLLKDFERKFGSFSRSYEACRDRKAQILQDIKGMKAAIIRRVRQQERSINRQQEALEDIQYFINGEDVLSS